MKHFLLFCLLSQVVMQGQNSNLAPNCAPPTCSPVSDAPARWLNQIRDPHDLKVGDICEVGEDFICYKVKPAKKSAQLHQPLSVEGKRKEFEERSDKAANPPSNICTGACMTQFQQDVPAIPAKPYVLQMPIDEPAIKRPPPSKPTGDACLSINTGTLTWCQGYEYQCPHKTDFLLPNAGGEMRCLHIRGEQ